MEPWMRAFLIVLGALALLTQPGPFLNDEVGQMASLTSLADGSLLVQPDLPEGYEPFRSWAGNVVPPPDGEPRPHAGSMMTSVLALPLLFALRAAASVLGPLGAVGLVASAAVGTGLWAWQRGRAGRVGQERQADAQDGPAAKADVAAGGGVRADGAGGDGDAPGVGAARGRLASHLDSPWLPAVVAAALVVGAALMQVRFRPPSSPYLEAAALQWVGIGFHAFASALVYDMLRSRVRRPALATALYAFGTPALFWGLALKYHGVAIALAAIVVWLYQEGHRTGPLRTGLAFAVAGLALWNHLPNGMFVLGSLAVMATPSVLLGLRPLARRAGAAVVGLIIGVIPDALDRMAHNAIKVRDRFIQVGGPDGGGTGVQEQIVQHNEGGRLQWAAWNDPAGPFEAAWQLLFWTDITTTQVGAALPLLALLPLAAILGRAWRGDVACKMGRPLVVWPVVHVTLMLVLVGRGLFINGWGFDFRHASTMWPMLVVPAAGVLEIAGVRGRGIFRAGGAVLAGMAAVVWVPFLLVRHMEGRYALLYGPSHELIQPLRYIGVLLALGVLTVWLHPRLRPSRRHAAAVAVAWALVLQVVLQLGPARNMTPGGSFPFVAWPVALLEAAAQWLLASM